MDSIDEFERTHTEEEIKCFWNGMTREELVKICVLLYEDANSSK